MSGRRRLAAVLAVGVLALVASLSPADRISIDLPSVASSVDGEMPTARVAAGTMPTRVKPAAAKHGRTAPLLPAATLVAIVALLLYGFSIAGAPAMLGRLARSATWSRSARGPPARLSV